MIALAILRSSAAAARSAFPGLVCSAAGTSPSGRGQVGSPTLKEKSPPSATFGGGGSSSCGGESPLCLRFSPARNPKVRLSTLSARKSLPFITRNPRDLVCTRMTLHEYRVKIWISRVLARYRIIRHILVYSGYCSGTLLYSCSESEIYLDLLNGGELRENGKLEVQYIIILCIFKFHVSTIYTFDRL